ncbi:formyltransferase family protein [Ruegeria sp. 2205SS24-7]|uniref:formyltransferase family protein n=1 Tax=Ruegeria discodermiae TaxID=3064389 RepID=UPI002741C00D|nr:formyltransferase family protein [Ruegeria sp. 2205SS24-7]MDP5217642.1 formyltransferase family protein [Ruegeria sp. 2205SS24-7]
MPAPSEQRARPETGLRIVVLAAFNIGQSLLNGLISYEQDWPDKIRLLAVSTDDAVEETAKISMKRRIWRFYPPEARLTQTASLIEVALQSGLPVYTGELKTDWFRRWLADCAPDLIVVTGCGQILDEEILAIPTLGAINFHPADLPAGHGAGAQPYQDLVERSDPWTRWTVHKMTTEVDAGPVIGVSCPIFAGDANGQVARDPEKVFQRMAEILPDMVAILLDEIIAQGPAIGPIDFEAKLSGEMKSRMRLPLE